MRNSATLAALLVLGLGGAAALAACADYYYPYTYGYGPAPTAAYQGYYNAPVTDSTTSGGYAATTTSGGYAATTDSGTAAYGAATSQGYYASSAAPAASSSSVPQVGATVSFLGCPVRSQSGCATATDQQGIAWDVTHAGGENRQDFGRFALRYTGMVSAQSYCTGGPALDNVTWVQTNQPC